MKKILMISECPGVDLYLHSIEGIKIIKSEKNFIEKDLSSFSAVVINEEKSPLEEVKAVQKLCYQQGRPLLLYNEKRGGLLEKKWQNFFKNSLFSFNEDQFFIGNSLKVQNLKETLEVLSKKETEVFILGETGTGKEVLANLIYRKSLRVNNPFVAINCAAIPPSLAESQMFGVAEGAYTDAVNSIGFLERAHNGTLFLDEIPDLSLELQGKFLRALEEKTFFPLGGKNLVVSDFRLLSASNHSFWQMLNSGQFRQDLFYRISDCIIEIPPLRERVEDIPLLCRHFLAKNEDNIMSEGALDKLMSYKWPGNVRELENVLNRVCHTNPSKMVFAEDIQF